MIQRLKQSPILVLAQLARFKPHWILQILLFLVVGGICLSLLPAPIQAIGFLFDLDTVREIMSSVSTMGYQSLDYFSNLSTELLFNSSTFQLFALYGFGMTLLGAVLYVRFVERRPIASMGARRKGAVKQYLVGMGVAVILMMVSSAVSLLLGLITITPNTIIPALVGTILVSLPAWLIQGAGEEFLYRGYLMPSLVNGRMPAIVAALVSSALFAASHLLNAGYEEDAIAQVFCIGLFLAFYILKTGSIWGACAIHGVWNYFSMNVFGDSASSSLFVLTYTSDTSSVASNWVASIVIIVFLVVMLYLPKGWYKPLSSEEASFYTAKVTGQLATTCPNNDLSSFQTESQNQIDTGRQRNTTMLSAQTNSESQQNLATKQTPNNIAIKTVLIIIACMALFLLLLYIVGYAAGYMASL